MESEIKKWGNSAAIRKLRLPFNESVLLNGLDAHSAHADEIALIDADSVLENFIE